MDLDQEIEFIYPEDKNFSPEERHKWSMPEPPTVPKDLKNFQQKSWPKRRTKDLWKLLNPQKARIHLKKCQTQASNPKKPEGKGKGKAQMEQALPPELQNSTEEKDSHR
ncbi:hypothetical protein O181_066098 [Austropuccinia psidii MF-1]|uniref:Uncharacterized protein n=1 Tax=Austropuccinia psidii MF-1 TaxID=1389203 RepID=A0A9Q3EQT6_9BASI|nr:hypothetical protein [Austropuccinia psidii MF-1]